MLLLVKVIYFSIVDLDSFTPPGEVADRILPEPKGLESFAGHTPDVIIHLAPLEVQLLMSKPVERQVD